MTSTSTDSTPRDPARVRQLTMLLALAVPVSVVHYVDSVANFAFAVWAALQPSTVRPRVA